MTRSLLGGEDRPWGRYDILAEGDGHKVKTISVAPGQRLSLQRHAFRAEHWTIVSGSGVAVVDDDELPVTSGSTVVVPIGAVHRILNSGSVPLVFIEVQLGTSCAETDIERLSDDYGRVEGS